MHLDLVHGLDLDRALHATPGAVLLVVTKDSCGACRATKAALAQVPSVPGLGAAWEIDAASAPALVEELAIFHLPALWIFRDGEPIAPVSSPPVAARLAAALAAALAVSG